MIFITQMSGALGWPALTYFTVIIYETLPIVPEISYLLYQIYLTARWLSMWSGRIILRRIPIYIWPADWPCDLKNIPADILLSMWPDDSINQLMKWWPHRISDWWDDYALQKILLYIDVTIIWRGPVGVLHILLTCWRIYISFYLYQGTVFRPI